MNYDIHAKKRFGQHFLHDATVISRTIDLCKLRANDQVIEIGPGQGVLTRALAATGANITAVEYDRELIPVLCKEFAAQTRVRIIEADFLEFVPAEHTVGAPYILAGNIPYNLTSPIIDWLVVYRQEMVRSVLMMQREVARRVTAVPKTHDWGPLALFTQLAFDVRSEFDVSPIAFTPPPKVWSSVVTFTPRADAPEIPHPKVFDRVVRGAFAQRRKLLTNNLIASLSLPPARISELLSDLGWSTNLRAEELDTMGFLTLTERLLRDRLILPSKVKE